MEEELRFDSEIAVKNEIGHESLSLEEQNRLARQRNLKVLESLGVRSKVAELNETVRTPVKSRRFSTPRTPRSEPLLPTRRSARLSGKEPQKYSEVCEAIEFESIPYKNPKQNYAKVEKRENSFGHIDGVDVGTLFDTRMEASHAGIHRPTVAGIHGNTELGCYSIALSGGYEDDVDLGDEFIFTGEGGRDLKGTKANPKNLRTAAQSKNQVLSKGNLALSLNVENRKPVRVIRGYKLRSKYAPESGYRYDGLYTVEDYYETTGLSGFIVYKFRMKRIKDQPPAPWHSDFWFSNESHSQVNGASSDISSDGEKKLIDFTENGNSKQTSEVNETSDDEKNVEKSFSDATRKNESEILKENEDLKQRPEESCSKVNEVKNKPKSVEKSSSDAIEKNKSQNQKQGEIFRENIDLKQRPEEAFSKVNNNSDDEEAFSDTIEYKENELCRNFEESNSEVSEFSKSSTRRM